MRQWVILLTTGFLSHGNHRSQVSYSFQEEFFFHYRPSGKTGKAGPLPANTKQKAGQRVPWFLSHSVVPLVYPPSLQRVQQQTKGTRGMFQLIQEYQPPMAAPLGFGFTISKSLTTDCRRFHKSKPRFLQDSTHFDECTLFPSCHGNCHHEEEHKTILASLYSNSDPAPDNFRSLAGPWYFILVLSWYCFSVGKRLSFPSSSSSFLCSFRWCGHSKSGLLIQQWCSSSCDTWTTNTWLWVTP